MWRLGFQIIFFTNVDSSNKDNVHVLTCKFPVATSYLNRAFFILEFKTKPDKGQFWIVYLVSRHFHI